MCLFLVCALIGPGYNLDPGGQNSCDLPSPSNLAARDVIDTVTTSWMPNEIDAARPDSCYCGNTGDTAHRFFFCFVLLDWCYPIACLYRGVSWGMIFGGMLAEGMTPSRHTHSRA